MCLLMNSHIVSFLSIRKDRKLHPISSISLNFCAKCGGGDFPPLSIYLVSAMCRVLYLTSSNLLACVKFLSFAFIRLVLKSAKLISIME